MYELKFHNKFNCLRPFGKEMSKCVKRDFGIENIDLICYVPAKKSTLYTRGFNQSELFAKEISFNLNLKFSKDLIKYRVEGKTQHRLKTVEDRFKNVRNLFKVTKKLSGKNILLVDDIKTTGASLDECARQLKFAGADKVYCVTALVTRVKKDREIIDL